MWRQQQQTTTTIVTTRRRTGPVARRTDPIVYGLDHLNPNLPFSDALQDLYSADLTQESCHRSCRLFGSHPATWAIDHADQQSIYLPWKIWITRKSIICTRCAIFQYLDPFGTWKEKNVGTKWRLYGYTVQHAGWHPAFKFGGRNSGGNFFLLKIKIVSTIFKIARKVW